MDAVAQVLPERPPIDGRLDMTEPEASFLRDAGVDLSEFAPREHGAVSPLARTAAENGGKHGAAATRRRLAPCELPPGWRCGP